MGCRAFPDSGFCAISCRAPPIQVFGADLVRTRVPPRGSAGQPDEAHAARGSRRTYASALRALESAR
jgi:hypothetical protein